MGLFKWVEQEKEWETIRYYDKNAIERKIYIKIPCPYCSEFDEAKEYLFKDEKSYADFKKSCEENRNKHIKEKHKSIKSIILVNGKVCNGLSKLNVAELDSLDIAIYDQTQKVKINGEEIMFDSMTSEKTAEKFEQGGNVKIEVGDLSLTINRIKKENFDSKKIENHILQWNNDMFNKHKIQKDYSLEDYSEMEIRCLNGFFDYFIATTASGNNKKNNYEHAQILLSEFVDILPVAKVVTKIISLKYNSLDFLSSDCNDLFHKIYVYLTGNYTFKNMMENKFKDNSQIYIEDNLQNLILTILEIYDSGGDYDRSAVNEFVKKYNKATLKELNDKNFSDQVYLILARKANYDNDKMLARECYYKIVSPCYTQEKRRNGV